MQNTIAAEVSLFHLAMEVQGRVRMGASLCSLARNESPNVNSTILTSQASSLPLSLILLPLCSLSTPCSCEGCLNCWCRYIYSSESPGSSSTVLALLTPHYGARAPPPRSRTWLPHHHHFRTIRDTLGLSNLHLPWRENALHNIGTLQPLSSGCNTDATSGILHPKPKHRSADQHLLSARRHSAHQRHIRTSN